MLPFLDLLLELTSDLSSLILHNLLISNLSLDVQISLIFQDFTPLILSSRLKQAQIILLHWIISNRIIKSSLLLLRPIVS